MQNISSSIDGIHAFNKFFQIRKLITVASESCVHCKGECKIVSTHHEGVWGSGVIVPFIFNLGTSAQLHVPINLPL
jgi:hypothetical protein